MPGKTKAEDIFCSDKATNTNELKRDFARCVASTENQNRGAYYFIHDEKPAGAAADSKNEQDRCPLKDEIYVHEKNPEQPEVLFL